jgi:hypothetical protein
MSPASLRSGRSRAAFTLLEVCLSLGLLLSIVGIIGVFQMRNSELLTTISTGGLLDESSMHALETVSNEMRWAEATSLVISVQNGSSRLDFRTPAGYAGGNPVWSTLITYVIEPTAIDWNGDKLANEGRLVRMRNGQKQVICDYVVTGGFVAALGGGNLVLQLRLARMDKQSRRLVTRDEQTSISLRN